MTPSDQQPLVQGSRDSNESDGASSPVVQVLRSGAGPCRPPGGWAAVAVTVIGAAAVVCGATLALTPGPRRTLASKETSPPGLLRSFVGGPAAPGDAPHAAAAPPVPLVQHAALRKDEAAASRSITGAAAAGAAAAAATVPLLRAELLQRLAREAPAPTTTSTAHAAATMHRAATTARTAQATTTKAPRTSKVPPAKATPRANATSPTNATAAANTTQAPKCRPEQLFNKPIASALATLTKLAYCEERLGLFASAKESCGELPRTPCQAAGFAIRSLETVEGHSSLSSAFVATLEALEAPEAAVSTTKNKRKSADSYAVVFRGSHAEHKEVERDLDDSLVPLDRGAKLCPGALVHAGLYDTWTKLRDDVSYAIEDPHKPVICTGHGSGAALCALAMFEMQAYGYEVVGSVVFNLPKVGNAAFAKCFKDAFEGFCNPLFRVTNGPDLSCGAEDKQGLEHVGIEVHFEEGPGGAYEVCPNEATAAGKPCGCAKYAKDTVPSAKAVCRSALAPEGDFCTFEDQGATCDGGLAFGLGKLPSVVPEPMVTKEGHLEAPPRVIGLAARKRRRPAPSQDATEKEEAETFQKSLQARSTLLVRTPAAARAAPMEVASSLPAEAAAASTMRKLASRQSIRGSR